MVILALVNFYFLYLALLVSYNWWVGNGGWCNLIIPIIILAIAPQDHILGTDEINVQVSKLKLYLNILYKQERGANLFEYSRATCPTESRNFVFMKRQKQELSQCLKSKNLILLNIWGIFAWRLENLVCVPISLIAATFSTFISISFSFLFIIHPTALPRWGRLINSNRNLNSQPTISFISRDCSDYAFLQSTKWGTILCLQETFRTQ